MSAIDKPVKAKILLDGQPIPSAKRGSDIAKDGTLEIKEARLYNLVDTGNSYENHTLTIEFAQPGVKAFAFTFG